jgi:hypothetical protein
VVEGKESKKLSFGGDLEMQNYEGYDKNEVKSECRYRLLKTMKSLIWERYEKGKTSAKGTHLLDNTVDIALDSPSVKIPLWANIHDSFS